MIKMIVPEEDGNNFLAVVLLRILGSLTFFSCGTLTRLRQLNKKSNNMKVVN